MGHTFFLPPTMCATALSGMLLMAVWCANTMMVTAKVAFTAGSSTHKKALERERERERERE